MPMAVEKPDLPVVSSKFQGIFNANVSSELATLTESKMDFFYDWLAVKSFASASKSVVSVVNVVNFPARITVFTVKLI